MCKKELDWALGYFTVFPGGYRKLKDLDWPEDEPYLFIYDDCPSNIRERLLKEWPRIVEETKKRHKEGYFSSHDAF